MVVCNRYWQLMARGGSAVPAKLSGVAEGSSSGVWLNEDINRVYLHAT
jgi:hypothetical protein